MIVDSIRTKNIDDKPLLIFLEQRMDTVHNNKKRTDQKAFGATATLTSILDMIKSIIGAKIPA